MKSAQHEEVPIFAAVCRFRSESRKWSRPKSPLEAHLDVGDANRPHFARVFFVTRSLPRPTAGALKGELLFNKARHNPDPSGPADHRGGGGRAGRCSSARRQLVKRRLTRELTEPICNQTVRSLST
ncbi:hypothetical protein EYF80_009856 [Liparis tanakae]|uniref:Uncharacterized protein n=1 Tax=Liparis tanakae TaxID=230148 RepID=A0A4Z2IP72_9TELE|nr:hypothetical protein EYF80_009856 [Liparis tanakae]